MTSNADINNPERQQRTAALDDTGLRGEPCPRRGKIELLKRVSGFGKVDVVTITVAERSAAGPTKSASCVHTSTTHARQQHHTGYGLEWLYSSACRRCGPNCCQRNRSQGMIHLTAAPSQGGP
jgi:hypothetical protein